MAIVLVDADGDGQRRNTLKSWTTGLLATVVVAVAKQEFEAWLIADHSGLIRVLGRAVDKPPKPESLPPGQAKARLKVVTAEGEEPASNVRRELASSCDLEALRRACRAFERFRRDVSRLAPLP